MLYFVYISSIFRESSLEELAKMSKFKIIDESLSYLVIDSKEKDLPKKVDKSIFIYCAFPILSKIKINKKNYLGTILSAIKSMKIPKEKGLKLECIDINERHGYSAKDIEVKTGLQLEKLKYNINIVNPDILAYVVLLNGECYSGYADYNKMRRKFVNPMRYYHTKKIVSRAELKIREAFDEFNITGNGTAIDLGAAPGGWSHFLAKRGLKVIAIDNGELDYKAITGDGVKITSVTAAKAIDAEKLFKKYDIIHVRSGFKDAQKALKIKKVDMLVDDMNIFCSDTAAAINSYLKFLKKDAMLIITVKCVSKKVPNYIVRAKKMLGKKLKIVQIRVLPNNRQEITVFARY